MTPPILHDLSPTALTHAIEENLFALVAAFQRWPRAQTHVDDTIRWSLTDVPFPLFNGVFAARFATASAGTRIRAVVAQAEARRVPLLWWTGPRTRPTNLAEHLLAHGFVEAGQLPGMAITLTPDTVAGPAPAKLSIRVAANATELAAWSATCSAALDLPAPVAEANHDFMRHVDPLTTRAYVSYLDGVPVATSVAMFAGGVAGIYNVATLPAVRRQGIGQAMTLAPMRDALAAGHRAAILHATAMAEPIYRRMGFRDYCRIGQYLHVPATAAQAGDP